MNSFKTDLLLLATGSATGIMSKISDRWMEIDLFLDDTLKIVSILSFSTVFILNLRKIVGLLWDFFKRIFPLLLVLFTLGCSPQKKLERLIKRHPSLLMTDTLTLHDTVLVPSVFADTMVGLSADQDTIYLERDRLQVKVRIERDSIYIAGHCRTDTLYLEKKVPVERIRMVKADKIDGLIKTLPYFFFFLACFAIYRLFKK